jgi:hypothetical protein
MTTRLTPQNKIDRRNFVLDRLRDSLTRNQITDLIVAEFDVSVRTARDIYRQTVDGLIDQDPSEQRRNRVIVLEQLYHQAAAAQADISALQALIERASRGTEYRLNIISNMVAEKGRVRGQLVKTYSEIARIYGLYTDMSLLQAISVLANSEMLPPEIAGQILMVIEDMTSMIEKSMKAGKNSPAAAADQN